MDENTPPSGTPLVLVISDEEWVTRSIESILQPKGYAVLTANSARQGLDLASRIRPDLLLVGRRLPDATGVELCVEVRKVPTVRPSTPVLLFTSTPAGRRERIEGFEAGVWGILHLPFEPQELLARLEPYIAAKRDVDAALEMSHLDPLTGFYNLGGLMRRVTEMSADTARSRRPIACVALGPAVVGAVDEASDAEEEPAGRGLPPSEHAERPMDAIGQEVTQNLGHVLLSVTRLSDAVGRVGDTDFVIVAPGTGRDGAVRLAERVMNAVDQGAILRKLRLKAGLYATHGTGRDAVIPEELLRRATGALRDAQAGGNGKRIHPFHTENSVE